MSTKDKSKEKVFKLNTECYRAVYRMPKATDHENLEKHYQEIFHKLKSKFNKHFTKFEFTLNSFPPLKYSSIRELISKFKSDFDFSIGTINSLKEAEQLVLDLGDLAKEVEFVSPIYKEEILDFFVARDLNYCPAVSNFQDYQDLKKSPHFKKISAIKIFPSYYKNEEEYNLLISKANLDKESKSNENLIGLKLIKKIKEESQDTKLYASGFIKLNEDIFNEFTEAGAAEIHSSYIFKAI